jgi:IS605 OrfB family transposase
MYSGPHQALDDGKEFSYTQIMKLTIQLQLLPAADQKAQLLETMERFNEAATFAARVGFEHKVYGQVSIHGLVYHEIRERFGLSAQMAVRAIAKAVECFQRDRSVCPVFKPHGAICYDQRVLSFKGLTNVSLWAMKGRLLIPFVCGAYQESRLGRTRGQADLVYRKGKFYLLCTIEMPEGTSIKPMDVIGVDLGIVNIAADSTGEVFSGAEVQRNRRRRATARKQHQRKGSKRAKRKLKQMSGRQRRFQTKTNHEISKKLVAKAKALGTGIAMEDLSGIRDRVEPTVSRRFRRQFGNWGFSQLRLFVEYKARLAGVPLIEVDARNSSRTCSKCGHCEKGNRPDQATFRCKHCGHSTNADLNAAENLRIRGLGRLVNRPQESPALND